MITYVCDFCGYTHNIVLAPATMYELTLDNKRKKKRKIHICENCLRQICEKSVKQRRDTNGYYK